jgi:YVTN family beta-propeller protein
MRSLSILLIVMHSFAALGEDAKPRPQSPQPAEKDIKLPDGWTLTPAGLHLPLAAVPLNLIPSKSSKSVHVGTSSIAAHQLSVIELATGRTLAKADVGESWYGLTALTFGRDEVLIWSGGASGLTHFFRCTGTSLTAFPASKPEEFEAAEYPGKFRSGIAARGETHLYAWLDMEMGKLCVSTHGMGIENFALHYVGGKQPLDVAWSRDQHWIYVSDWADRRIIVGHLPGTGAGPQQPRATIEVGERPNQIAVHPTDWRVFVACAGSNSVTVIDGKSNTMIETISTRLEPTGPQRSNPDALALAPDGKTLYVTNADNHNVAVIDVTEPKMSVVKGFIPTGWNPTAVSVTPDGKTLLIGTIKATDPLPTIPEGAKNRPFPYTATKATGELWIVPIPDEKNLNEYTAQVHKNCPSPVGESR